MLKVEAQPQFHPQSQFWLRLSENFSLQDMSANGTNTAGDVEVVRQLIKGAFPPLTAREDLRPLSHNEALQMRSRLTSLRNEDLPFYLCQILEDLLDTHTGKAGESQDAEAVVQQLNVLVEGTDLATIRE